MMDALGKYLISVSGSCMIIGIILAFGKNTAHHAAMKMVCGIFLLLCIIRPFADISLTGWSRFALPYLQQTQYTSQGEEYARQQTRTIIKQKTQAYILDKAAELDADIRVEVKLSDDPLPYPVSVEIYGTISPYTKQKLEQILSRELSIAKENQSWIW